MLSVSMSRNEWKKIAPAGPQGPRENVETVGLGLGGPRIGGGSRSLSLRKGCCGVGFELLRSGWRLITTRSRNMSSPEDMASKTFVGSTFGAFSSDEAKVIQEITRKTVANETRRAEAGVGLKGSPPFKAA